MKRALLVSAGTVAGIAGVLVLNPDGAQQITATRVSGSTGTAGSTETTTPESTMQTVQSDTINTRYGPLQLEVTVENGKITEITELQMPADDGRSIMISQQAGPMLREQALQAQSASIAGVSGATYTSVAYMESLQSALDQLGI